MSDNKTLISSMSRKWKLEQIPSKKLEIENKLMEERLNQLKTELLHDKSKRSAMGGTIWATAQPGSVKNNSKNNINEESLSIKLSNRQVKLQVLKDEYLSKKSDKSNPNSAKEKKAKCGQCEKNIAFTRCLECGEDYCANCFTSFHMKGALQKHRTVSLASNLTNNRILSDYNNQNYQDGENFSDRNSYRSGINSANQNESRAQTSSIDKHELNKKVKFSLLEGEYDEREAQKSFEEALLEWRNGSTKHQKNLISDSPYFSNNSKDAVVGTEQINDGIKALENRINSNHSLSYAERMLLQKYRRNQFYNISTEEKNDINQVEENSDLDKSLRETVALASSQHINFESIIESLKGGKINQYLENEDDIDIFNQNYIRPPTDLKLRNEANDDKNNALLIEEVDNSFNLKSVQKFTPQPEILETEKSQIKHKQNEKFISPKFINSLNSTNTKSSSVKNSLSISQSKESMQSMQLEHQNLNREPSSLLKHITNREIDKCYIVNDDSKLGDFLMLDVEDIKEKIIEPKNRISSSKSRIESARLSHKFYSMTPRSWNPNKSIVNIVSDEKVIQADNNKNQTNNSFQFQSKIRTDESNKIDNKKMNKNYNKDENKNSNKEEIYQNRIKTPINVLSSTNFNSKNDLKNPKNDFKRNKSFVSSVKTTKKKNEINHKKRPASINDYYNRPVSRLNIDFGDEFSEYDVDDGRSSRVCQNEDDNDYFGGLINEFKDTIFDDLKALNDNKHSSKGNLLYEQDLKDLADVLNNNMNNLESSLRNNDYDEEDGLESMTMEELRLL